MLEYMTGRTAARRNRALEIDRVPSAMVARAFAHQMRSITLLTQRTAEESATA
jgi:hypothetical protein